KPGSSPNIQELAHAQNLSKITFRDNRTSLVEVREEFKRKGLREQERQLTFALRATDRRQAWKGDVSSKISSAFDYMLFELTCRSHRLLLQCAISLSHWLAGD